MSFDESGRLLARLCALVVLLASGCAMSTKEPEPRAEAPPIRATLHRDHDDLLTAGLGHAGLLGAAPAVANPEAPTPAELRRRAMYANWRGIVDLVGTTKSLPNVPGREFASWRRVAGAKHPHRVLVQIPDAFDVTTPCLIVTASSGSRGIYGAIGTAGHYGLMNGCAVAYTDKGAGTDWFDPVSGEGTALDGTLTMSPELFRTDTSASNVVAIKHAHSGDNPEADWGHHVLQAAVFGLDMLGQAFPAHAPFTKDRVRVIAFGLSNGGGAVLRAGEQDNAGLIDAVVAIAPNIHVPGSRPLFDVAVEAALFQPCALLDAPPHAFLPEALWRAQSEERCRSLKALNMVEGNTIAEQARSAREHMKASGFTDAAQRFAGLNQAFDLWRVVAAPYAQAYARAGTDAPVCGYRFAAVNADGTPRATTRAERSLWWSDASGLAPSAGVVIEDTWARKIPDPAMSASLCLFAMYQGSPADAALTAVRDTLYPSIEDTLATAKPRVPVIIVHGTDDSLVPMTFSGGAYAKAAKANATAQLAFWEVPNAQHFDAFVTLPAMAGKARPLLPVAFEAMDRMRAFLDGAAFPEDRLIE